MEYRKNAIYTAEVTDLASDGNGVCRLDGYPVFVPYTAVGDTVELKLVKVNKSYGFGRLERVCTPSASRTEPVCPAFYRCGGCSFQHIDYPAELAAKQGIVENAFRRIGKLDAPVEAILPADRIVGYRNKAQYPFGVAPDGGVTAGFYARRSHRVVPCSACALQPEIFGEILRAVVAFANRHRLAAYTEADDRGILRNLYLRRSEQTGDLLVCLVVRRALPDALTAALVRELCERFPAISGILLNLNPKATNVILGEQYRLLYGKPSITDTVCGVALDVSPAAFFQVNRAQAERLYQVAKRYAGLTGRQTLLDLYCGVGAIGLALADGVARLIGAEIVPEAVENAAANAEKNGIRNAEFLCADAGEAAETLRARGVTPDVVLLDPPRKGCGEDCVRAVARMSPERVVMISCNPSTAARDCATFRAHGYLTERIQPVDLFPRTAHVECVVLMTKSGG